MDNTTIALVPEKVRHPHGMQIMFQDNENHTRNIFVYAENSRDYVDWYNCIRSAKLNRLRIAYPGAPDSEVTMSHMFVAPRNTNRERTEAIFA